MGLTAAFVLVPVKEEPEHASDWVACTGASPGWAAFTKRWAEPRNPGAPWELVDAPFLAAFVMDSDFGELALWDKGKLLAEWTINPESRAGYGHGGSAEEPSPQEQAAERAQIGAALEAWCRVTGLPAPDPEGLDDLLSRGWVLADEGLFTLLVFLGLVPDGGYLSEQESPVDPQCLTGLPAQPPARVHLDGGLDDAALPAQPQRMLLAAPINHDSADWTWFVASQSLEKWGKPGCVVADSLMEVPAGGLQAWTTWMFYLATDPPVNAGMWSGTLGNAAILREAGPWVIVPQEVSADLRAGIGWARENVGTTLEPPAPDREPLLEEMVSPPLTIDLGIGRRGQEPSFGFEVSTYLDLLDHTEALAAWVEQARKHLVEPFVAAFGDRVIVEGDEEGPAYGAAVALYVTSLKERSSALPSNDEGWAKGLRRLRNGELRYFSVTLSQFDGLGRSKGGLNISVELRDQFSGAEGPLGDGHPAKFVVTAAKPLVDGPYRQAWIDVILRLMRDVATTFDAAYGYASADGNTAGGFQSPYERRHNAVFQGERLDAHARGLHWGNLIGPGHLEAIGGVEVLRELLAQGQIASLEPWDQARGLWWFRLNHDPFGPDREQADRLAAHLSPIMPAV